MSNPGPASTTTSNVQNLSTQQALRLVAYYKGLSVAAAGDTPMKIVANADFVPTVVVTVNANVTMATATVGIYTAPAAGGTAVLTTAALTGQTSSTFAYVRAATAAAAKVSASPLYANVGTTVATGTVDIFLYGYDVSTPLA
jgi:hypothetical protein